MRMFWSVFMSSLSIIGDRIASSTLQEIDFKTLELENGLFAHVLVDVDLASMRPDKILVERKSFNFFVNLMYERMPQYCLVMA